jgi:simple sugar transport system ATP-binding protein
LLSGGNLQKVILARELEPSLAVLLALHPTRGLDARASLRARQLLLDARDEGAAVLLWSEDLEEILALSDRVAVIVAGRITHTVDHDDAELATVGRWMTGGDHAA